MPSGARRSSSPPTVPTIFSAPNTFEASEGNRFDRLRVVQDGQTFGFVQTDYSYATPASRGSSMPALFALPANSGFDPVKPWRLELLVNGAGAAPVTVAFGLDYKVPGSRLSSCPQSTSLSKPAVAAPGSEAWSDAAVKRCDSGRAPVGAHPDLHIPGDAGALSRLHTGWCATDSCWLFWSGSAGPPACSSRSSMSSNYVMAPFKHLDIGFYLAEPLMVIIAGYTLVSVVLIGRGVFCGWLCPFGALQELLGQLSRALRVPQWNPPAALEKRLWMGKYIAAAAVLVLVMTQIDPSGPPLEIEPFKTAITSKFTRAWPYVLYAGALLAIGLFSERAYCRFLCPLGGVLACPRSAAPSQSAQASSRMRQSLPSVRTLVSGAGDRADRQDHHRRVLSVPRLPGRIL